MRKIFSVQQKQLMYAVSSCLAGNCKNLSFERGCKLLLRVLAVLEVALLAVQRSSTVVQQYNKQAVLLAVQRHRVDALTLAENCKQTTQQT